MKHLISLIIVVAAGSIIAGTLDQSQGKWIKKYEKQQNVPDPAKQLLNTDPEPDLSGEFTALFNGRDLTGWTPLGGTCTYEVKDGSIVGTCVPGSPSTYLCTEKDDYTDFLFVCEMKWEVDGNSGVMIRSLTKEGKNGKVEVYGPQVEMEGEAEDRDWSGGIYGQGCGGFYYPLWLEEHKEARAALKPMEWNRMTVAAKGSVVKTWINGVPVAHWVNDEYPKGRFGLQVHSGKKGQILWRNLKVRELK